MVQNNIIFNFNFNIKNRYSDCQTKSRQLDWHPCAPLGAYPEHSVSFGRANEVHKTLKAPSKSLIRAWEHRFDVGLSAEKHFLIWPQRLLTKCLRTKTKAG
jgi:hypothetical protein